MLTYEVKFFEWFFAHLAWKVKELTYTVSYQKDLEEVT